MTDQQEAPMPEPTDTPRIGTAGSICKCGLAKSYHGDRPWNLAPEAEYEPRYLEGYEGIPDGWYVRLVPEPGADAAWEALYANLTDWPPIARFVVARHRPRIEAALARPTPALDVEALAEAMCRDREPEYDGPIHVDDECRMQAGSVAAHYAAILEARRRRRLAARATEGGTDR